MAQRYPHLSILRTDWAMSFRESLIQGTSQDMAPASGERLMKSKAKSISCLVEEKGTPQEFVHSEDHSPRMSSVQENCLEVYTGAITRDSKDMIKKESGSLSVRSERPAHPSMDRARGRGCPCCRGDVVVVMVLMSLPQTMQRAQASMDQ